MGKGPRIQHVSIVGTKPITKLEYYSKHFRNVFIAILVIAVAAVILGGLIVGNVIHVKEPVIDAITETIPDQLFGSMAEVADKQHKLTILGNWLIVLGVLGVVVSSLAIPLFQWLSTFDRPVSPKTEAFLKKSLQKLVYRTIKRAETAKNRDVNKDLKAKFKAEYKAKKK